MQAISYYLKKKDFATQCPFELYTNVCMFTVKMHTCSNISCSKGSLVDPLLWCQHKASYWPLDHIETWSQLLAPSSLSSTDTDTQDNYCNPLAHVCRGVKMMSSWALQKVNHVMAWKSWLDTFMMSVIQIDHRVDLDYCHDVSLWQTNIRQGLTVVT